MRLPFPVSILASLLLSLPAAAEEVSAKSYQITGEVPEGWEVVELTEAPLIEKWVVLKDGEKRKILVRPFGLKPVSNEESKFTVKNPLEASSGQNMSEVVEAQNENLAQSQDELSTMLLRLKQLLLSLPNSTESQEKS